jgi:hypothetical protein
MGTYRLLPPLAFEIKIICSSINASAAGRAGTLEGREGLGRVDPLQHLPQRPLQISHATLRGLEVKTQEGRWYLFSAYQVFRQLSRTASWNMPASFWFEKCQGYCLRMAVAQ